MRLREIVDKMDLEVRSGEDQLDAEVNRGYSSDLLSDVIAHTQKGNLWITLQIHINIVAVASMKELSGIILINGREPEDATLKKAVQEKIPIFVSKLPAFELIGRLYQLGIPGMEDA